MTRHTLNPLVIAALFCAWEGARCPMPYAIAPDVVYRRQQDKAPRGHTSCAAGMSPAEGGFSMRVGSTPAISSGGLPKSQGGEEIGMSTKFEDCSEYERDMRHRVVDINFERACFLSRPSVMFGLVPVLDGNAWSVLHGTNLQEGVAGFGDSPDAAMAAFDKAWVATEMT